MADDDQPQEITCSGGIKLNFGAIFGDRAPRKDDDEDA